MNGLAFRLVMLGEPWVTLISVLVFLIGFFAVGAVFGLLTKGWWK